MNLTTLFTMQTGLDSYIKENQEIGSDVFQEKGLALLVELAELANETRCFKFWSTKGPSDRSIILEEYVDSIHFLLSLGIEKGLDSLEEWPVAELQDDLTGLFIRTFEAIHLFLLDPEMSKYKQLWVHYGKIADGLGFSYKEIMDAYVEKNDENYKRQQTGY